MNKNYILEKGENKKMQYRLLNILYFGLGKNIGDITNVDILVNLQICNFMMDALRIIFLVIYKTIGSIVDYIYDCFNEIMMIDFTDLIDLGSLKIDLLSISYLVLGLVAIIMMILSLIKMDFNMNILKPMVITVVAITCFGTFTAYVNGYKKIALEGVEGYFKQGENLSISEKVLHDNGFDMLATLENNELTHISYDIPLYGLDINETMSKNDLQGVLIYDVNGNKKVDDLSDGWFNSGFNEERYYRYSVSFVNCLPLLFICGFIYFISMFKVAYVNWNAFYNDLYGGLIMAVGCSTYDKIKLVYTTVLKCAASLVFVSMGAQIFGLILPSVLNSDYMGITKIVILFVGGMITVLGSGAVNQGFGLDDGTAFMFKSMMLTKQMSRVGKGLTKPFHKASDAMHKLPKQQPNTTVPNLNIPNPESTGKPTNTGENGNYKTLGYSASSGSLGNTDLKDKPLYGGAGVTPGYHKPDATDRWDADRTANTPLLENKDFSDRPLEGGEGMTPGYHEPDIKDKWDAEHDAKIAEKKARHEELMKNQNQGSVDTESTLKPSTGATYTDKYGNQVPVGKEIKPYSQYKKDFKNGNDSVYNDVKTPKLSNTLSNTSLNTQTNSNTSSPSQPSYISQPYGVVNRGLPAWYLDQSLIEVPKEEIDTEDLMRRLRELGEECAEESKDDDTNIIEDYASKSKSAYEEFLASQGKDDED